MAATLMISAKLTTLGLLKIMVFRNKGHDFRISVIDVTNKILSLYLHYIVDVVMWPKFGNYSISMREVIITWIFKKDLTRKTIFLRGALDSSSVIWDWYEKWSWNFTYGKKGKTKSILTDISLYLKRLTTMQ